jgi:hypothetical protein
MDFNNKIFHFSLQNTTQKTNDLSNTNYQQPDDELGAPQWYAVSTPLVAHLSS